jgi:hypothetical protein
MFFGLFDGGAMMSSTFKVFGTRFPGCVLALMAVASGPAAAEPTYTTFDPPGSANTNAVSINGAGTITGYYLDASGTSHGFVRAADGTITSFDPAGSTGTYAVSINRHGVVAGSYSDSRNVTHGYVRWPDGTITSFDPAGSTETRAGSINGPGTIAGSYTDSDKVEHGYLRGEDGSFTSFDVPRASATYPTSINGDGAISGGYGSLAEHHHFGFEREPDGTISTFTGLHLRTFVSVTSINDEGTITGFWTDPDAAFVRAAGGAITTFRIGKMTFAESINSKGFIAGSYVDDSNHGHGFVRRPDGAIRSFDVPKSEETAAFSINNVGQVVGSYLDSNNIRHGFLRTPACTRFC